MTSPATIQTPLGSLAVSISAQNRELSPDEYRVLRTTLPVTLPPPMAVDSVEAFWIELNPRSQLLQAKIACSWMKPPGSAGRGESGEHLDAWAWQLGASLVLIGTEDQARLTSRLREHGLSESAYPVQLVEDAIEILLPIVPGWRSTSLHFIVASNRFPEDCESSAWFAVDVPHQRVRAAVEGQAPQHGAEKGHA